MRRHYRPESGRESVDDFRLVPIQTSLIAWYEANACDLPWRQARNPFAILVSEIMLQQIQVSRAIPFYLAFLERFPAIRALAEAPIADVIHVWGDLDRYRRITNLHASAKRILAEIKGERLGFYIHNPDSSANTVLCSNEVSAAASGFANVDCAETATASSRAA